MAANTTVKSVLSKFGIKKPNGTVDGPTIKWLTDVVGVNSASDFLSLSKHAIESIGKRLSKDATTNSGAMPAGATPSDSLRVVRAIELVSIGVKFYASRGVAVDAALMTRLNHANAVRYFELVSLHRQKDVDKDSHPCVR